MIDSNLKLLFVAFAVFVLGFLKHPALMFVAAALFVVSLFRLGRSLLT